MTTTGPLPLATLHQGPHETFRRRLNSHGQVGKVGVLGSGSSVMAGRGKGHAGGNRSQGNGAVLLIRTSCHTCRKSMANLHHIGVQQHIAATRCQTSGTPDVEVKKQRSVCAIPLHIYIYIYIAYSTYVCMYE